MGGTVCQSRRKAAENSHNSNSTSRPRIYPKHIQSKPGPDPRLCWEGHSLGVTDGRTQSQEKPPTLLHVAAGDPHHSEQAGRLRHPRVATCGNEGRARVCWGGAV